MSYILNEEWAKILSQKIDVEFKTNLFNFINNEYKTKKVYPPKEKIFNSLNFVPINNIKVVIIGQDPYHVSGQADGLAFSCANGKPQPSLINIFKEISADLGLEMSGETKLDNWAKQGVLLLNTSLTVIEGQPTSHSSCGWLTFTRKIVEIINQQNQPIVFLLWGAHAKSFADLLNNPNHLVLTAAHPSPFSAYNGFFGCSHFSKCNSFLVENGITPIDWQL
ncbi:MAG: uracil-DNA glycosylase [Clostridia bacterium]|nr:uracil-DNA glycosylase [Clostridia bacterium]